MINVAIIGVGNIASALVQGVEYYKLKTNLDQYPLLKYSKKYINEINFSLGIDIDSNKVGKDLSHAIFISPNCSNILHQPTPLNANIYAGHVLDSLDSKLKDIILPSESCNSNDICKIFIEHKIDVIIILLPTGSQKAAEYYANEAIKAGCCIINGMPANLSRNEDIINKLAQNKVNLIGDDMKSQIGATILHEKLVEAFVQRGGILERTIQLDWGGGMDFANLTSNDRYEKGKRHSKTEAILSKIPNKDEVEIKISAVDYIPFLGASKEAYIRLEGKLFGEQNIRVDMTMQVQDNFNAAGVITEAIILSYKAKQKGIYGLLKEACALLIKNPYTNMDEIKIKESLEELLGE